MAGTLEKRLRLIGFAWWSWSPLIAGQMIQRCDQQRPQSESGADQAEGYLQDSSIEESY
jgi:hypothetical protein